MPDILLSSVAGGKIRVFLHLDPYQRVAFIRQKDKDHAEPNPAAARELAGFLHGWYVEKDHDLPPGRFTMFLKTFVDRPPGEEWRVRDLKEAFDLPGRRQNISPGVWIDNRDPETAWWYGLSWGRTP